MMTNFNYFSANKAYGELYLQFPKVFLYSDKYKDLSDSAKIAYMVFKDRLQYSIQNNWIDEAGHVYFIYTNKELQALLNCSEHKVIKIKKELTNKDLLLQTYQGFNPKKKKNEPNRLYLADLEVEAYEVYAYQNMENNKRNENKTLDTSGTAKNAVRYNEGKTLDTSGTAKNAVRYNEGKTLDISGTAKNAVNQYKYNNYKDNKDDKDHADIQNQQIQNHFSEQEKTNDIVLIDQYISEHQLELAYGQGTMQLIKSYSFQQFDQFKMYIDKFYFGMKSAERELEITIHPYEQEALHQELASTFKRVVIQYKQGKIKNINDYLYISLKNVFVDFANSQKTQDLPPVPLKSWLNS